MRRLIAGLTAFLALTATLLVLPVYAAPAPEAEPVEPSIEQVALGSVEEPAPDAVVTQDGEPVAPEPGEAPVAEGEAATSGEELPSVLALTVSQPQTDEFSAVGVTWVQDAAVTGVLVQLRVREVGGGWGEWTVLEEDADQQDARPSDGTGPVLRSGTAPYFTGRAHGVEVIVQDAAGRTPEDVQLQLIDPGTSPADSVMDAPEVVDQAGAAAAMPAIYSRAQWGADESLRTWDPTYSPTVEAAAIHHTAGRNDYTADEVPSIIRSIYAYHAVSRGWGDIGYNFLVDKFGRAWEGRYSGERGISSPIVGAHTGGFNSYTFGISMMGDFSTVRPTSAMVETVAAVAAWKLSLYGVDPSGWTTLTSTGGGTSKYPAGTAVNLPTIFGHRDVGSTTCPGDYGYAQLGTMRKLASERVAFALAHDPRGYVDTSTPTAVGYEVSGWALDPDGTATSVPVAVSVDGTTVARFTADDPRPDIGDAYPGAGNAHGYRYAGTLRSGRHTVCVTAENAAGPGGSTVLGCREFVFDNAVPRYAVDDFTEQSDGSIRIRGWAFDPDGGDAAVHLYDNGTGRAYTTDVPRPDVAAVYPSAGSSAGFDITQGPYSSSRQMCLFIIDPVAAGNNTLASCKSFGYQAPTGLLDQVAETVTGGIRVRGWALDTSVPTASVPVHVYVDGRGLAISSTGSRPDIGRSFAGAGDAHGFDTTIAEGLGEHQVCVFSINVGILGPHTLMGCRSITLSYIAPQGVVDQVAAVGDGQVRVRGWAVDRSVPSASVEVHYYVDGRWYGRATASGSRPDIGRAFPGAGNAHGFDSTIAVGTGSHEICTFAINVGVAGTNPLVNCTRLTA